MRFGTFAVSAVAAMGAALAQQSAPPQRTMTTRPVSSVASDSKPATGAPSKGANQSADSRIPDSAGAFDSLNKSLEDLNAIRDGNLSLVQKDGCAPELASRIADLKAKLNGSDAAVAAPAAPRVLEKTGDADPLTVANEWFKPAGASKQTAPSRTRESSLLDAVLNSTPAPAERSTDPRASGVEHNNKLSEAERASVQSELEQLSNACAAKK